MKTLSCIELSFFLVLEVVKLTVPKQVSMNCALHKPLSIKCTLKEGVRENETVVLTYRDEIVGCCLGTECNDMDKTDYQLAFKETDDIFLIYSYSFRYINISDLKYFRVCLKEVNHEDAGPSNNSCLDVGGNIEVCSSIAIATPIPDVASLVPPACNETLERIAGFKYSTEQSGSRISADNINTVMASTPGYDQFYTATTRDMEAVYLGAQSLSSEPKTDVPIAKHKYLVSKNTHNASFATSTSDDTNRVAGHPVISASPRNKSSSDKDISIPYHWDSEECMKHNSKCQRRTGPIVTPISANGEKGQNNELYQITAYVEETASISPVKAVWLISNNNTVQTQPAVTISSTGFASYRPMTTQTIEISSAATKFHESEHTVDQVKVRHFSVKQNNEDTHVSEVGETYNNMNKPNYAKFVSASLGAALLIVLFLKLGKMIVRAGYTAFQKERVSVQSPHVEVETNDIEMAMATHDLTETASSCIPDQQMRIQSRNEISVYRHSYPFRNIANSKSLHEKRGLRPNPCLHVSRFGNTQKLICSSEPMVKEEMCLPRSSFQSNEDTEGYLIPNHLNTPRESDIPFHYYYSISDVFDSMNSVMSSCDDEDSKLHHCYDTDEFTVDNNDNKSECSEHCDVAVRYVTDISSDTTSRNSSNSSLMSLNAGRQSAQAGSICTNLVVEEVDDEVYSKCRKICH